MSPYALPTAIAGAGIVGRNLIVDNESRPRQDRVNYRLIMEPRGPDFIAETIRRNIGNLDLKGLVRRAGDDVLEINGQRVQVCTDQEIPFALYKKEGIARVMESTGFRLNTRAVSVHEREAIVTANLSDGPNIVVGVNEESYDPQIHKVIGNGSCTTKSCVGVGKALAEGFGVESYSLVTTHAHTGNKRAELAEMIKTGRRPRAITETDEFSVEVTGAGKGIGSVVPALRGKVTSALAVRGPVINGSFTTINFVLKKETTTSEIITVLRRFTSAHPNVLAFNHDIKTTAQVRQTKADGIITEVQGSGRHWTFVIGYNNEEAPARAANDLALFTEGRLAA